MSCPCGCEQVLLLPYLRALRRLAEAHSSNPAKQAKIRGLLVSVGVPRLVVRLMSWADTTGDEAVMLQVH